ncbi:hypothetical protein VY88_29260 [Azospirillum thiophilum]|uniref:Glycosyltransferase 2-like domain-containing protein n=1 Tax=Azospirillum thiophilum TaxID=528244 RepID=A0AAC8W442_9PROT|nr:glycosyltransferase [Azospirillum thiophilum]ALG74718.1 hypothetical protein AL072_27515 [Azospirillum thiophilum]KJR61545.1 hypothetical protein VY88_29260 [Azospirillum thiophilum]
MFENVAETGDGLWFAEGWVVDLEASERPVVVELLVDGQGVAAAVADLPRHDLGAAAGRSARGFRIVRQRPGSAAAGSTMAVRVANTDWLLPGSRPAPQPGAPPARRHVRGDVDGVEGLTVSGWVHDPAAPADRLSVDLMAGDRVIASGRADRFRSDLLDAGIGDGAHGFRVTLPPDFAHVASHAVQVVVRETGRPLNADTVTVEGIPTLPAGTLETASEEELRSQVTALACALDRLTVGRQTSLPFRDYPAWKAMYGTAATPADAPQGWRCLVLVIGNDDDASARTEASLAAQSRAPDCVLSLSAEGRIGDLDAGSGGLVADRLAVVPLLAGETLAPDALVRLTSALAGGAGIAYGDYERMTDDGPEPLFSPDWNDSFFLHRHYIGPACAIAGARLGAVDPNDGPADLFFRAVEAAMAEGGGVHHIPHILAARPDGAAWPDEAAAVERHLSRRGLPARVGPASTAVPDARSIDWEPRSAPPSVSVIVPTRDALALVQACLDTLLHRTAYPAVEVILADNGSQDPATLRYFAQMARSGGIRILPCPGPFNYAAINNRAAVEARGEILAFVNNDIEIPENAGADWLVRLTAHFVRPEIGVVGPKLLYPNGMVQHGGVVLGVNGLADHSFRHARGDEPGYDGRLAVPHEVSAVTAAFLLTRRSLFLELGGFDAEHLPVAFNDVDYCLKVGAAGQRVLFDPTVALLHRESATRGTDSAPHRRGQAWRENECMKRRWAGIIGDDPFYNPNLGLDGLPFSGMALPPRRRRAP